MAQILVADPIAEQGIQRLTSAGHSVDVKTGLSPIELESIIPHYDGLVVRSETKVTARLIGLGARLQVIGRAGVGVDNIDLDAATQQGIPVVNAPTGNTIAATEHTLALMLALARHIPQAHQSVTSNEWRRREFQGIELRHKTLGIVGLGKVGSEVARRAQAFQMNILAYDPYVPQETARQLDIVLVDFDTLISKSDFITLHTPLTADSKQLIGADQLARMKRGVKIINAARGGLIDEQLLDEALKSGAVGGAALDVFSSEPPPKDLSLLNNPKVILTPHLGASTAEAQVNVAVELAEQIVAVLAGGSAPYTVNAPYVPAEVLETLAPFIPVATLLGKLAIQLTEGQLESVKLTYTGKIGEIGLKNSEILKAAVLVGILGDATESRVTLVNASLFAQQRGLPVEEVHRSSVPPELSSIIVEVLASKGKTILGGTSVNNQTHLVQVNDFSLDLQPTGKFMMFTEHADMPGMIGRVGTIAGEHDINISFMEVGRQGPRGQATMLVGFDDPIPPSVLAQFLAIPNVTRARLVEI